MLETRRTTIAGLGQLFDGPHATPTRRSDGPYFLNIASLKSGRLDLSESDHVSEEDFVRWTRRVTPRAGDLLFSYETRLGEAALMPEGVTACLGRRMALLRPNRSVVDPRFLLYFYLSPSFQRIIAKNTIHGATVPRIGLATMPKWEVVLPELRTQCAIAEVLGALDGKIAVNDQIHHLADEMCAAEVRSATASGVMRRLRDILVLSYGKALPASHRVHGDVAVYGSGGRTGTHDTPLVDHSGVVIGRKGTVGAVYWADGPHFPIDTTYFVEPMQAGSEEILFYLLRSMPLSELNSDSAVPGLNRDEAYCQLVRIPTADSFAVLGPTLRSRFAWMRSMREETNRLVATRDELLPLLMSGKVRVRDAEKAVGEVV